MSRPPGAPTKACRACHRAKRKCGKQMPLCARCRKSGIECTYPASKPSCFVLCDGFGLNDAPRFSFDAISTTDLSLPLPLPYGDAGPGVASGSFLGGQIADGHAERFSLDFNLPGFPGALSDNSSVGGCQSLPCGWLGPSEVPTASIVPTEEYEPFPQPEGTTLRSSDLKRHVSKINRWFQQWVNTGSNPFIHKQLYRTHFPRCMQDAYMALSCYLKKTPSNEQVVLRIIEERATQLLQDYAVSAVEASPDQHTSSTPNPIDCLEYVARVQALLVYQFLGLYDGDIRMRFVAESRIPALYSSVQQLLDRYTRTTHPGNTLNSPARRDRVSFGSAELPTLCSAHLAWDDWILAETIRRTAIVACGVQAVYLVLQQSGSMPCQTNITYTPQKEAWEADSSLAWEKVSSTKDMTLVQITDTKQVFTSVGLENVDDFTMLILEMRNGID
ncbi:uncharacterized protein A1O9_07678 [Exophiala aquamarina CBS 119918]|uniref:Zn(2)-C6 fungal-type domain-containing protein n=1 Tax=Exophiala aquamarina CBS 119918 TaxID=1182545 RepID=A0A072P8M7_9EURO|nr:uncharacterized protein A1O9_07678 [Exophiala aquamarina CBS 119918]KEF56097.1 hypothetical protein A1O9_07678 [Exophiala aquamarina CBS 119918]